MGLVSVSPLRASIIVVCKYLDVVSGNLFRNKAGFLTKSLLERINWDRETCKLIQVDSALWVWPKEQ